MTLGFHGIHKKKTIVDIDSSNTSPSYSPSLPDMASTLNYEMDNMLHINNNNKITQKSHQYQHNHSHPHLTDDTTPPTNGKKSTEHSALSEADDAQHVENETEIVYSSAVKLNATRTSTEQPAAAVTKSKNDNGNRIAKYGKINGTTNAANTASTVAIAAAAPPPSLLPPVATSAQLSTNTTNNNNNNVEGSYHCQFCDKSFPRLGYLKKHEQVSDYDVVKVHIKHI